MHNASKICDVALAKAKATIKNYGGFLPGDTGDWPNGKITLTLDELANCFADGIYEGLLNPEKFL